MSTSTPKLHYFSLNGKGSAIRAIFNYTNTPYENKMYSFEEWPKVKENFEFKQMPMLEYKGLEMVQAQAILITLAREFKLLGNSFEDEYHIQSLMNTFDDMWMKIFSAMVGFSPEANAAIPANKKALFETHLPFYLPKLEARFNSGEGKYMVGNCFTLADIVVCVMVSQSFGNDVRKEEFMAEFNKHAPNVSKHITKIRENELANFFKTDYINTFI